ncbi:histidine phosphatase family protein [Radicibacter daui]|uniref:histidine phosphatase family protein n=1 Tax=Radicibacter daui TaxID=3064829 RepID=UPI004046B570
MIWLLRHGETEWNIEGRYQGALDSALTATGRAQAEAMGVCLARHLAGSAILPERALMSPLGRTRATAGHIARFLPPTLSFAEDPALREVSGGSWDGLTQGEIEAEFPGVLAGSGPYDWFFRTPDGEGLEAALARAEAWLSAVTAPTLALSHGLFGRLIRGLYLGLSRQEMLELPMPQDGFYLLADGKAEFIG